MSTANYVVCVRRVEGAEWVADSGHATNKDAYARADSLSPTAYDVCVLTADLARLMRVEVPPVGWSYVTC
jgi:hypothetical protein